MRILKAGGYSALVALTLLASLSCGSDSDDGDNFGSGSCSAVCACVSSKGGDSTSCQSECQSTVSMGGNVKIACEGKLDDFGYPECKSTCAGFHDGGSGAGGSSGSGGSGASGGSGGAGGSLVPTLVCTGDQIACSCMFDTDTSSDNGLPCGDPTKSLCCASANPLGPTDVCLCDEAQQWLCTSDPSGFCYCQWQLESSNTLPVVPKGQCRQQTTYDVCCKGDTSCSCFDEQLWGEAVCLPSETNVASCDADFLVANPNQCNATAVEVQSCRQ